MCLHIGAAILSVLGKIVKRAQLCSISHWLGLLGSSASLASAIWSETSSQIGHQSSQKRKVYRPGGLYCVKCLLCKRSILRFNLFSFESANVGSSAVGFL